MTGKQIWTFAAGTMRARWVCLSLAVLGGCVISSAYGQVLFDSHGFEAPNYSTTFGPIATQGMLEGQETPPNQLPNVTWAKSSDLPAASSATVESAIKLTGNQAVRLDRGANSNNNWGVLLSGTPPTQRYVFIDWDMRVEKTPVVNPLVTQFGPFFGVRAQDQHLNPGGIPNVISTFGVDATTGDVLYQVGGTGELQDTGGLTVGFTTWNHFQMKLDFLLGSYTFSLNNVPVPVFSPTGFVTPGITRLTDVPILGMVAGNNPNDAALTGTAYYDNFVIREAPEPATLVLATMSLVGILVAARRSRMRKGCDC